MSLDDVRDEMRMFRVRAEENARVRGDTNIVLEDLFKFFEHSSPARKSRMKKVIAEWLLADDEGVRFDALALTYRFTLRESVNALRELADRLKDSTEPSAPFELEKVGRFLKLLAS